MAPIARLVFLATVTCLLIHELDAVRQGEWRFFFAPVPVSDETAYRAFTAAHAPLFVLTLWFLESTTFQFAFDAFAIGHGLLHLLFRDHPAITFESRFSRLWIAGGALLGAGHLLLLA